MKKATCAECGREIDIEKEGAESRTGITITGLSYKVYVCDECWYDDNRWKD